MEYDWSVLLLDGPRRPIQGALEGSNRSLLGFHSVRRGFSSPARSIDPTAPKRAVRETKVTVKIPRPLYRRIQQVVDGSGFNSPTDFIVYVLRDLMGEAEQDAKHEFSQEELEDVKRKLKNLGYL